MYVYLKVDFFLRQPRYILLPGTTVPGPENERAEENLADDLPECDQVSINT